MVLGEARQTKKDNVKPPKIDENFRINGKRKQKVNSYKYLGAVTCCNGSNKFHLSKRKSIAIAAIGKINEIGFDEISMVPKIKGILF
jgi:hypothetical protein